MTRQIATRTIALVASLLVATPGSEAAATDGACPTSGLVGHWPAEGNASDVVGGNNGQLYGTATYAAGKVGQAFAFDGAGGYVKVPSPISGAPAGSVEAWVRFDTIGFYEFLGSGTSAGGIDPLFLVSGGWPGLSFGFCFDSTSPCTYQRADSAVVPEAGPWYHVVGTWGPAGMKLYVNAQEKGASPYAGSSPTLAYHVLGTSYWVQGQSSIDGSIDELRIYDCQLTADEVLAGCLAGGGSCGPTAMIAPAGTTCAQFKAGTAPDLTTVQYGVNTRSRVSSVSPTAFTYYASVVAPAASFKVTVRQGNTGGWSPLGNAWSFLNPPVNVFGAECKRLATTGTFMPSSMTFNVTGATPGAVHVIGIRYQADNVIGRALLAPYPVVTYSFVTSVNGVDVSSSVDSVAFTPK
jgi:hypothetical protein